MAHALLSPSSAHRWLTCTPSARLEEQLPDRAGEAAAEGTLAHRLAEIQLGLQLGRFAAKMFRGELDEIYDNPMYGESMQEYVDDYVTYVLELYSEAQKRSSDADIFLEHRIDLTSWVPEGFGTGDCVIIADGIMDVVDLKYGKGVAVSAADNKQMKMYALGALNAFDHLYDITTIRTTIYQPRMGNIAQHEYSRDVVLQWGALELKPLAHLAYEGKGELVAGDHCRFCKVKATCRAFADLNLQLARYEFQQPAQLSDEEIADVLSRAEMFSQWIKAVEEHALAEAINGKRWPGYKLVEGRSVRTIANEEAVVQELTKAGFDDSQIYNRKLQGITAFEKLLGKMTFSSMIGPYVVKPPGKPTLVPATDKRPEYHSGEAAAADFSTL